jgi:hypothetical protein
MQADLSTYRSKIVEWVQPTEQTGLLAKISRWFPSLIKTPSLISAKVSSRTRALMPV